MVFINTITYDKIEFTGGLGLCTLYDFKIDVAENQHATAYYKGISENELAISKLREELRDNRVQVSSNGKKLFCGLVDSLTVTELNGYYEVEVVLVSGSILLDQQPKSRSFQDVGMTYGEVIGQVIAESDNGYCMIEVGEDVPIGSPIIQYQETDWQFIKRLASHFQTAIYPEYTLGKPAIWLGIPKGREMPMVETTEYKAHISSKYYELGGLEAGYSRYDFLSYYVKSPAICTLGDMIHVHTAAVTVCRLSCELMDGVLVYTYQAGSANLIAEKKRYNDKITGMSILGTVIETASDTVKLHLDIDDEQDASSAYAYRWVPPSGNLMYLMPKVGTRVSLYFSSEDEGQAEANNCIRTNGGSECPEMGDADNRYLTTEHGKQMAMLPEAMGFSGTGSPEMPLSISMDDEEGMVLQSHLKIAMTAVEGVQFEALSVILSAASEFTAAKVAPFEMQAEGEVAVATMTPVATMNMALSSQQNLLGNHTVYCGWEFICYQPFDDAPQEGDFNWGKLILGVAAGIVAVVAVTALVATGAWLVCGALALTAAATATVVTGAVIGGVLVGGLYVGKQAIDDFNSGNASEALTYAKEGAIGSAVGAISGALTPVLGPISTPIVNGLVGGGAYVGEWAFRNAIGEEEPWSWTSLVINVGASAVGSSIGRKLGQVFTNRATTKALTQAADGGASAASKSPNAFSKAMSWVSNKQTQVLYSDFGAGIYATGNKAGRGIANAVGGEARVMALEQFGKNVDFAIMKGLTGENAEAARQLIAQDDYYRFAVGAKLPTEAGLNIAIREWSNYQKSFQDVLKRKMNGFNTATVVYDNKTGNYYYGMKWRITMEQNIFKKISLRGRMAYGIMCFEQMLIQYCNVEQWNNVLELLWLFVETNDLEIWGDKINEIVPEHLLEFDSYEASEFEYTTVDLYEYLRCLYGNIDNKVNELILKIYFLGTSHAYSAIVNGGETSLIVLNDIICFMKDNSIELPDCNSLFGYSIQECKG